MQYASMVKNKEGGRFDTPTTIFRLGFNPPRAILGRRSLFHEVVSIVWTALNIVRNRVNY
eukprot:3862592-Pleurochrysis_carterae.AAC.3